MQQTCVTLQISRLKLSMTRPRMYVLRTRLGDKDIVTPYMMTPDEYNNMMTRHDMFSYFNQRNADSYEKKDKEPFNIFDMNFSLGPLEKVFGPGYTFADSRFYSTFYGCEEQQD